MSGGRETRAGDARAARIVVLASGSGTNLQALMDACADEAYGARVVAVFSDRPESYALERARAAGIEAVAAPRARRTERADYDAALAGLVGAREPDLVLLLGWMRVLSAAFLGAFPGRVVNLHPALPGAFPGTRAIDRALDASRLNLIEKTGVMMHYVPDEGVDSGPVIATAEVEIKADDDLRSLERRVHEAEHRLVVATAGRLARLALRNPEEEA